MFVKGAQENSQHGDILPRSACKHFEFSIGKKHGSEIVDFGMYMSQIRKSCGKKRAASISFTFEHFNNRVVSSLPNELFRMAKLIQLGIVVCPVDFRIIDGTSHLERLLGQDPTTELTLFGALLTTPQDVDQFVSLAKQVPRQLNVMRVYMYPYKGKTDASFEEYKTQFKMLQRFYPEIFTYVRHGFQWEKMYLLNFDGFAIDTDYARDYPKPIKGHIARIGVRFSDMHTWTHGVRFLPLPNRALEWTFIPLICGARDVYFVRDTKIGWDGKKSEKHVKKNGGETPMSICSHFVTWLRRGQSLSRQERHLGFSQIDAWEYGGDMYLFIKAEGPEIPLDLWQNITDHVPDQRNKLSLRRVSRDTLGVDTCQHFEYGISKETNGGGLAVAGPIAEVRRQCGKKLASSITLTFDATAYNVGILPYITEMFSMSNTIRLGMLVCSYDIHRPDEDVSPLETVLRQHPYLNLTLLGVLIEVPQDADKFIALAQEIPRRLNVERVYMYPYRHGIETLAQYEARFKTLKQLSNEIFTFVQIMQVSWDDMQAFEFEGLVIDPYLKDQVPEILADLGRFQNVTHIDAGPREPYLWLHGLKFKKLNN